MTARVVFICDVCGAVTDDHYRHPVTDARFRARATGWTYRRHGADKPKKYRLFVDLCPEHTYSMGFITEPNMVGWRTRLRPNEPDDPQPLTERTPSQQLRYEAAVVVHHDGDGPYRLYTSLVRTLRELGADRGTTEQIRREMFAPGADWLQVAGMWAHIKTEEDHAEVPTEREGAATSEPGC